MTFEIWRHRRSDSRYLVVVRDGQPNVAAGSLAPGDDPREVLERHGNQNHNPQALLPMRRAPYEYEREYTTDAQGRAVEVPSS